MYWYVLEEVIREIDECNKEDFGSLDSNEKTIAFVGDGWWPQAGKQEGDKTSEKFPCNIWKHIVAGVSIRSGNGEGFG